MINKLRNEKGSITVYVLVAMLFLLAIVTARYLLANRQLKTQVAALGRIQNVYGKAYSGGSNSGNNTGGDSGDSGDDTKLPGGTDPSTETNPNVAIPIYNADAFYYFRNHANDWGNVDPYYIYQDNTFYIGGSGKKYKLMSDITVDITAYDLWYERDNFLQKIDFNNHVIYTSDNRGYWSYQNWFTENASEYGNGGYNGGYNSQPGGW